MAVEIRAATYAALRTALAAGTYQAGQFVFVEGRASANDGGQGMFQVKAIGSLTDDGGVTLTGGSLAAVRTDKSLADPSWYGAVGDGVSDDTAAIVACVAALGGAAFYGGKNYLISSPIVLQLNGFLISHGKRSTLTAASGFTSGRGMVEDPQGSTINKLTVENIEINGNGNADHCIRTYRCNTSGIVFRDVFARDAVSHGVRALGAILVNFESVYVKDCGGDGFLLEDSNAALLLGCRSHLNNVGMTIKKGTFAYSSGVRIFGGSIETNATHGLVIVDASTTTVVRGAWFEGNGDDAIRLGSGATYVPVDIQSNIIIIAANGSSTNRAVNIVGSGVRGIVRENALHNSSGSVNYIEDATDGRVDTRRNYNGNDGALKNTVMPSGKEVQILECSDAYYEAVAYFAGPGDTVTYTPIIEVPTQSATEIEITGADNNSSVYGIYVVKTWSVCNVDEANRSSFAEIGGGTNPATVGTHYFPIGDATQVPYVRWNGNALEIKQRTTASDRMMIRVKCQKNVTAVPVWQ